MVDGRAADVWSLGVTLFTTLMACLPWNVAGQTDPFYCEVGKVGTTNIVLILVAYLDCDRNTAVG
jgi:hypothetical protein